MVDFDYASLSDRTVTLVLPRDFAGQIVDGLSVLIEQWDATAEYHEHGQTTGEPIIIREAKDANEAIWIANFYRAIRGSILEQIEAQS
jgi:hypothetical protein